MRKTLRYQRLTAIHNRRPAIPKHTGIALLAIVLIEAPFLWTLRRVGAYIDGCLVAILLLAILRLLYHERRRGA